MTKQHILQEIKRTAMANGGVPLGRIRFFNETGIRESDWKSIHWIRWNDAVREAGLTPNKKTQAYDDKWLIMKLISLSRDLGHFPIYAEIAMKTRNDQEFPHARTFDRLGTKSELVLKIADYCQTHEGFEDVLSMCRAIAEPNLVAIEDRSDSATEIGFVYLLKSGRFYKIGRTNAGGRREYELAIQLPEKANIIHQIRTDDPVGIENYWHMRFENQRKNGEWFDLNAAEIKAFKRRKFM
jgi:Meiotically up-regulated gene 113